MQVALACRKPVKRAESAGGEVAWSLGKVIQISSSRVIEDLPMVAPM
jgi:hypothetical protein